MDPDKSLAPRGEARISRRDFEEVIRLASEIASRESDAGDSDMAEAEVYRIAAEVGLRPAHVQQALAQVRRSPGDAGRRTLQLAAPPWVRAARVVPGSRSGLAERIEEFMVAGRLLQSIRRSPELMVYWPAVDWVSQIARTASATGRKYYVASAKRVEVRLEAVEAEATWVEIAVDPGLKANNVAGATLGGLAGGAGSGFGAGLLLTAVVPFGFAVAIGVAAGTVVAGGIATAAELGYRSQVEKVRLEIEGILDHLARGTPLEPPPASWRRWVSRHFRGIAREMSGRQDD